TIIDVYVDLTEGNMSRPKGSKNKNSSALPHYFGTTSEERIKVLANLIVDRLVEDQADGQRILKIVKVYCYAGKLVC
ncbi:MAG TPA: hypothetical protein VMR76_03425, partial [Candidatus Saccharimonadia bacterium]|nr:hypothetical protein [Candidatus Saccharimonadia bacterium]